MHQYPDCGIYTATPSQKGCLNLKRNIFTAALLLSFGVDALAEPIFKTDGIYECRRTDANAVFLDGRTADVGNREFDSDVSFVTECDQNPSPDCDQSVMLMFVGDGVNMFKNNPNGVWSDMVNIWAFNETRDTSPNHDAGTRLAYLTKADRWADLNIRLVLLTSTGDSLIVDSACVFKQDGQ